MIVPTRMSTAMNCSNEICGAAEGADIAVARGSKSERAQTVFVRAQSRVQDKSVGDGAG
jgi:hypothetical protein